MATLSIPLDAELTKFVEDATIETGLTKAGVVRQALKQYAEEKAVQKILAAQAEPTLNGDLDELLAQV
ncbi:MAG: hypothetical protein ACI9SY_000693 [Candidatus Paceibacteria bacterium]|jgi:hypothetical protein